MDAASGQQRFKHDNRMMNLSVAWSVLWRTKRLVASLEKVAAEGPCLFAGIG